MKKKKKKQDCLSFVDLRIANVKRCNKHFHPVKKWSTTDWACALAGEVGELCNYIKKMRRGEKIPLKTLAKELGDIVCYADLLAARLDIDLGSATRKKFNEVSIRKNSSIKL